jgi:hypothetical protein
LAPVAERFGYMDSTDIIRTGKISDGAGYAQDSCIAARR